MYCENVLHLDTGINASSEDFYLVYRAKCIVIRFSTWIQG